MSKFENLKKGILNISNQNDNFTIAKKEWELEYTQHIVNSTCLCKHNPITECCFIKNIVNGNRVMVGNCCVKHFEHIPIVDWYFDGLKRIKKLKNPNLKMIQFLYGVKTLNEFEYKFLLAVHSKKKYTPAQKQCQKSILCKLKEHFTNNN